MVLNYKKLLMWQKTNSQNTYVLNTKMQTYWEKIRSCIMPALWRKIGENVRDFWRILYLEHDQKNYDLRARGQWTKNIFFAFPTLV
jgi:hypothetical protein